MEILSPQYGHIKKYSIIITDYYFVAVSSFKFTTIYFIVAKYQI